MNHPPVARVVEYMVVTGGDTVILDGSASSDTDNHKLFCAWTQKEEPVVIEPFNPHVVKPIFSLMVTDLRDVTDSDTVNKIMFFYKYIKALSDGRIINESNIKKM